MFAGYDIFGCEIIYVFYPDERRLMILSYREGHCSVYDLAEVYKFSIVKQSIVIGDSVRFAAEKDDQQKDLAMAVAVVSDLNRV